MKTVFRTAALAAFILTAASFGLAAAANQARADGWYRGHHGPPHAHGRGHRHGWHKGPRHRSVIVLRTAPVYAPPRRVVVIRPAPVIVRPAPVYVQPAPVQQAAAYCREYTETVTIGGDTRIAYGTACWQPDGSWQKQN